MNIRTCGETLKTKERKKQQNTCEENTNGRTKSISSNYN